MDVCDEYCISSGTTVHITATAIKIPATAYITRNRRRMRAYARYSWATSTSRSNEGATSVILPYAQAAKLRFVLRARTMMIEAPPMHSTAMTPRMAMPMAPVNGSWVMLLMLRYTQRLSSP